MAILAPLPNEPAVYLEWSWSDFEPYFADLQHRSLSTATIADWLTDWSSLSERIDEISGRLYIATACDTSDTAAEERYHRFIEAVYPCAQEAEQRLREQLLASRLEPDGFALPLRKIRAETALFRPQNLSLQTEERKLEERYNKIAGNQTVLWEGQELPIPQMLPVYQDGNRDRRELAWRTVRARQLADRTALNQLWQEYLGNRLQQARNADQSGYREYRWQQLQRFDYTPEDCLSFHEAIAEVVVPAATRALERRRQRLGLDTIRPWDLEVDPSGSEPLHPYQTVAELIDNTEGIFGLVDPELGKHFGTMRHEDLLDLASRPNKGPGGFCSVLPASQRPYIFMNAVGIHDDVQTMFHEGGHAFHVFESVSLPWYQQRDVGHEFAEVASMAMELLVAPYLASPGYGFYNAAQAARARIEHLESTIRFWPYMAVIDAFQHWAYSHPEAATDPNELDRIWADLYLRYHPAEDWTGLEAELMSGWHRKLHIFTDPFYYVEYGLAQLGAIQVWANARRDQAQAVAAYRHALSLGGTRSIPDLYAAAGAHFSFDANTLREAVGLMETVIAELEAEFR